MVSFSVALGDNICYFLNSIYTTLKNFMLWVIEITFPNVFFLCLNVKNCFPELFYIICALYYLQHYIYIIYIIIFYDLFYIV